MKLSTFLPALVGLGLSAALVPVASAQATEATQAAAPAPTASAVAPTQVYVPQLPTATELITAANAQHMSIDRIEQGNGAITAVYRSANGATNTVVYLPMPANEAAAAGAPAVGAPPPGAATTSTTVVYGAPYYGYGYPYPYYYPYGWYPAVGIRIGGGWGYRGGWGWGGRGGWRR